jgi:peptidyl-prolyl cis-trans isomerase C
MGLLATIATFPGFAQTPVPLDATVDPIVATVEGAPLRRSDILAVQQQLPPQFQQVSIEVLFPLLVERLIDAKLIAGAGRKDKLDQDADVKRRIAQFEERVVQETYLTQRIGKMVTPRAVRARYDKFVKDNPPKEEISARHILVATEAEATKIIGEIKGGADFAKIAGDRSIDPAGKQQGGSLGYFAREDMVAEFSEAAFKLKDGEVTLAPVKTQFGWHVIKVEGRRQVSPSFEEMQEQLASEMQQETVTQVVAELRQGVTIERFNLDGTPRKGP